MLLRDIVLQTYPMELIDSHLKSIVATRMPSACKSGNLEDLWEDLIFMNHILNFKIILKNTPELNNSELCNFEYGVHVPNVEMVS